MPTKATAKRPVKKNVTSTRSVATKKTPAGKSPKSVKAASVSTANPGQVNVVCMWWRREDGTEKFGKEYINRLYHMVEKNLTIPHRFIAFTEDATGLDAGIEARPLPPVKLRTGLPERGWKKLGILSDKIPDFTGPTLFLDLDVVIVDNIDALFAASGEFLIARDTAGNEEFGNSSVFRFNAGVHQDILDNFEKNFEQIRTEVRHEQAYMCREMKKKGIMQFWPSEDWAVSFKYRCMLPFPINWFKTPKIPAGAKIIVFHGRPNNAQAMNGYTAKFGIRHVRPVKWIKTYWRDA